VMTRILLTGFEPFDGKSTNSSWVAASALMAELDDPEVCALELPVVWASPKARLLDAIKSNSPQLILSMGEGKAGFFKLESLARNARKIRPDNTNALPATELIDAAGPEQITSSAKLQPILALLLEKGVPAEISSDAGGFLCEETLYSLERFCVHEQGVEAVLFVHLPPFGTELNFKNQKCLCNTDLLLEFGLDLFAIVMGLHEKKLLGNL